MPSVYSCPVCHCPLQENNNSVSSNSLICEQGHNFDRHKKGYINLLLAQHKKSKQPGDDSQMVEGRRSFLEGGHYDEFANKITELIRQQRPQAILDAGCGEGFYLNYILSLLTKDKAYIHKSVSAFGFDISKPAIQAAASQHKNIDWAVASSARAPYQTGTFDCIISIFSRVEPDEFSRLLKPGGVVIYAGPGPNHLLGLRELIYSEVKTYKAEKHADYFNDDFTPLEKNSLSVPLSLNSNNDIMNLVSMTPHGQRINKDNANRLKAAHTLNDSADFLLYVYQKIR